ncbi:ISL3 family transposase (plasmid) [Chlorobium phaeovibrioides]|uniref:ISL3 family transposase n=1 Tax=Chlorobium phaeovibrioides TaxID=1094 RepID=A0A5M8I8D2_CHLPH|nr:ISL3 family transposase [Chlorobium phaeovibrioides]KAA6230499.1 ISL3 family transposase [Chlorobium phaeovibrioides]
MQSLTTTAHYQQLLGLPSTWMVENVDLSMTAMQVVIRLVYTGKNAICTECGETCSIYDQAPEQKWRHLDTMQFETIIIARLPRANCKEHGVKTVGAPWADRHSRFTLMFEGFVVQLLQHCSNTQAVSTLLGLSWHCVDDIMRRAVKRGMARRGDDSIEHLGIDEKSFRAGHQYVTIMNDLDGGRVLDVVETRTTKATVKLLTSLAAKQRKKVLSVSVDMWNPFAHAVRKKVPQADLVHDRYHISKYLNDAVDAVRRQESRALNTTGDKTLIGSKYAWLRNPENMSDKQRADFDQLMTCELQTGIAWSLKNMFRAFWVLTTRDAAEYFFQYWSDAVDRSKLKPIIKVKDMMVRHLEGILNFFRHRTTNAVSEGLNSKIQLIKASARGFHSFESYRTRILFYCGKLDMAI